MVDRNLINSRFDSLGKSKFRGGFKLSTKDKDYIKNKGIDKIREHAYDFVNKRLSGAVIVNDGRQTPMRGHPVFVAQHATGTCCRGCLYKWHKIKEGCILTEEEVDYVVEVIMMWIERQYNKK